MGFLTPPKQDAHYDARDVRGSNHSGMRQFNERTVLQAIRQNVALPKADIARLTQLSTQTVAIIVERLMADHLLIKHERIRGKIGQPSVPIALNPEGAYGLGIQIGRRGLELLVADFVGKTRYTWGYRYDYPDPDHVLYKIREGLTHLQGVMGEQWPRVVGVGLTAPLALHQWGDMLVQSKQQAQQALGQWEHINLRQAVQAMTDLPVEFAKDTTAACVAELVQGQGRGIHNFLYVFSGTFVGGGLVMDGHIVSGPRGNAGAIGSLPTGLSQAILAGKTTQKPLQLLELASGWQLEQALLAAKIEPFLAQNLAQTNAIMDPHYQAYTQPWLARASDALAMTVASATALVDLDAVVIDGSLGGALMDALITQTQSALSYYSFAGMTPPVVLRGSVGPHARAVGGALLPLHAQFFPDKDIFLKSTAV